MLYYPTLPQGVGSNDIGLDQGRLGQEHVVKFERTGNRVLLIEPNYGYRALSPDSLESLIALASNCEADGQVRSVAHNAIQHIRFKYLAQRPPDATRV
jgi:hypothetical protein